MEKQVDEQTIRHSIKVLNESIREMTKHRNSLQALLAPDLPRSGNKHFKSPRLKRYGGSGK